VLARYSMKPVVVRPGAHSAPGIDAPCQAVTTAHGDAMPAWRYHDLALVSQADTRLLHYRMVTGHVPDALAGFDPADSGRIRRERDGVRSSGTREEDR